MAVLEKWSGHCTKRLYRLTEDQIVLRRDVVSVTKKAQFGIEVCLKDTRP